MSSINKEVTIERVNDICGGYIIAHQGALSVVVEYGESPQDAIDRITPTPSTPTPNQ